MAVMTSEQAAEAIGKLIEPQPKGQPEAQEGAEAAEQEQDAQPEPEEAGEAQGDESEPAEEEQEAYEETEEPEAEAEPEEDGREVELTKREQALLQREAEASQARAQYINALQSTIPALVQAASGEFSDVKTMADVFNLMRTDPDRYNRFATQMAELQYAQAELQKAQTEQHKSWLQQEAVKLSAALPEIADPVTGPKLQAELRDYARKLGYSDQQLQFADAQMVVTLRNAMLYEKSKAAIPAAKAKAAAAPPVQKPGAAPKRPTPRAALDDAKARLKKTGSPDDAREALGRLLGI